MKKIGKYLLVTMILGIFLAGFGSGNQAQAATKAKVTNLIVGAKCKKIDFTKDGKKDTLLCKAIGRKKIYDPFQKVKVYINGKCVATIKSKEQVYSAAASVITLSNGKYYLYLHLMGDNDDGMCVLYGYQKGKFVKAVDLDENLYGNLGFHASSEIEKVAGKKIYMVNNSMSYVLGGMKFRYVYQYKGGKLKLQSKTGEVISYYSSAANTREGISTLTASRNHWLYTDKTLSKKRKKLLKNEKVTVTKVYIAGKTVSFYVKGKNGVKGWIKSKSTMKQPFNEIVYAG